MSTTADVDRQRRRQSGVKDRDRTGESFSDTRVTSWLDKPTVDSITMTLNPEQGSNPRPAG